MAGVGTGEVLLEREVELAAFSGALDRARAGSGSVLLVSGPAGIGKTRIVSAWCEQASAGGAVVFSARGGELETAFPYGVVRQLFEGPLNAASADRRGALLEGAAGLSLAALGHDSLERRSGSGSQSFGVLHGLYWLVSNFAAGCPVVLAVDDVHWADWESLEWLAYLTRRVEDLPVLVTLAARTNEPDVEMRLLDVIEADAITRVVRPAPLSEAAVEDVVRRELSSDAEPSFTRTCHEITAGNPFLLRELVTSLREDRIEPHASALQRLREGGPKTISRAVFVRLSRLPDSALQAAKGVALLGAGAELGNVAAVTGLTRDAATEAVDTLVSADVLQYGHPIDFVHPIVRQAVYSEIPPGERSLGHSRAARVLSDSGSTPDLVAAQLLATDPGGDAWVVDTLRRAAEEIFARGSPTAAADYLARALAEPPPVPERGPLLKRLGAVELVAARPHEAIGHLREALDHLTDPRAHAEALQELGRALGTAGQVQEAIQMYERASIEAQAVDAALGAEFEAQFLCLATMLPTEAPRAAGRLKQIDRLEGTTAAECSLLAVLALGAVKENRPPSVVSELADRALRNGLLGEDIATHVIAHAQAVWSLVFAESIDLAERACIHALDVARRRGATVNFASGSAWLSVTTLRAGEVWRAEAHGRDAYATATTYDLAWLIPISVAVLIDALLERGQLDEAEAILDRSGLQGEAIGYTSFTSPFLSRGRLRIGQRRLREGLEDCLECGRREQVLVGANTARHAWRSAAALAHLALGEVEEARTLAERELALAREFGAPRQLGIALRAAGLVEGGERALQLLQESADALEESPASLELARTLTDLGAALRRAKRRADSRDPLRRALELAHECGATTLEDRARQELLATGARPRRVQLSGVASLTASERRVAEMAAGGMTNKEIAQAQFVSARTVETHLAHVYRKLGISSRGALGPALAQESPEAIAGP